MYRELQLSRQRREDEHLEVLINIGAWRLAVAGVVYSLAFSSAALGLVLAFGRASRTDGDQFELIRSTPGGVEAWGWLYLICGLTIAISYKATTWIPMRWLVGFIHFLLGVAYIYFGLLFAYAGMAGYPIVANEAPPLTGPPTYLGIGFAHVMLAMSNLIVWFRNRQRARRDTIARQGEAK